MIKENYSSPVCVVTEIELEGFLCVSGQHEGVQQDGGGDLDMFNF